MNIEKYIKHPLMIILLSFIFGRILLITSTFYLARDSFVYSISTGLQGDVFDSDTIYIGIIVILLKVFVMFILEFLFSIEVTDEFDIFHNGTLRRIIQANFFLVISEFFILMTLILELESLRSINFVKNMITSGSLFSLVTSPSGYFTFWIGISCYIIGMLIYIIPRESDDQQKSMETIALFLFIRSIFLPI